ncbi:MAG: sulfite exporter TauE/SafE family protein [Cyanobacteria bacterium J083]|nr:MAG: sulfite exporter TauE/SafE family protein [Cyanobacteria bacterium J083]
MLEIGLYLLLGLFTGTVSGLIGIGGGVLLTPALVYLFGFSQHNAQGTTLALLVPPVSLLAAWTYYQQGDVNIKVACLIFAGFFIGGLLGAKFAVQMPEILLKRLFGLGLLGLSLKMLLTP